uniref:LTO1 maturation factor of ABCE1 n=1 Tax=Ornithorhynchus anatinus TaxID=9258 RepID=A0A6I8N0Z3_ORNAN
MEPRARRSLAARLTPPVGPAQGTPVEAAAMSGERDLFDAITTAEERYHDEGYHEGYTEGSCFGITEGRHYGVIHGAKIALEIGNYQGFALTWKFLLSKGTTDKDSKRMKILETLIGMIQKFPLDDPTYDKLQEDLEKIRGKFKQVTTI